MDERFVSLLASMLKFLGDRPVTPDSSLRDLGLDSMESVQLLFAIEDEYDVVVPEEQLTGSTFATAGSLWAVVQDAITAAGGTA
jgi:acyl carrier protein